jgi:hypothetical protein
MSYVLLEQGGRMKVLLRTVLHPVTFGLLAFVASAASAIELTPPRPAAAGVGFVNDGQLTEIGTSDTTVASIEIRVPETGFLVANSTGTAACSSATSLVVRLHNVTTAASTPASLAERRPAAGEVGYYSINYVFAVKSGTNRLTLTGSCASGAGSMTALTLNAVFVPTRY